MRLDGDLAIQLAGAENLETGAEFLDDTEFEQAAGIEAVAFELFEPPDVDDGVLFAKDVVEAALGQTAVQRHLAAFEAAHDAVAGDGAGALCAAAGVLAAAAAHALADALFLLLLPLGGAEVAEIHVSPSRSRAGAGSSPPCRGMRACRGVPPRGSFS